jgi:hypothetical protein
MPVNKEAASSALQEGQGMTAPVERNAIKKNLRLDFNA